MDLCKTYKTKEYKNTKAKHIKDEEKVSEINFKIGKNEIMGILGPSGAGKTSIFKMLTMIMNRTTGKIDMLG
jgi:ABC-type multidrug transport system ATPase subunit